MKDILALSQPILLLMLIVLGPPIASWYYKRWTALFITVAGYAVYGGLLALAQVDGDKTDNYGALTFLGMIGIPFLLVVVVVANVIQNQKNKK